MNEVVPWMLLAVAPVVVFGVLVFIRWLWRYEVQLSREPELRAVWRRAVGRFEVTQLGETRRRKSLTHTFTGPLRPSQLYSDTLPWLTARLGLLKLKIEKLQEADRVASRITLTGMGLERGRLVLKRSKGALGGGAAKVRGDLLVGETVFDQEFQIWGEEWVALAVLDLQTRSLVSDLLRGFVYVSGREPIQVKASLLRDELTVEVEHTFDASEAVLAAQFEPVLAAALRLAQKLVMPANPAERLALNLGNEPEAGVRARIARVLARQFAEQPETTPALVRSLEDPDPNVRLVAAAELGRVGQPVQEPLLLEALASKNLEVSIAAAEALGRAARASAVPALREAEERGPRELSRACQQAIAEIQSRLQGAEYGQLTLAATEAGALTLAEEAEPGRVSLAETVGGDLPRPARAAIAGGG